MLLIDTSIWIDHLRAGDAKLAALLEQRAVLMRPGSRLWTRDLRLKVVAERLSLAMSGE